MVKLKKLTILPILLIIISLATFTSLAIWDDTKKDVTYAVDVGDWQTPIVGVVFDDISVVYNGNEHSIVATLPKEELVVSYTIKKQGENTGFVEGNSATDVGKYEIIAKVEGEDFQTVERSAILTINPANLTSVVFEGLTTTYNSEPKSLVLTGLPSGLKVEYANNNKVFAGNYIVTATISYLDNVPHNYIIPNPLKAELIIKPIELVVAFSNYNDLTYSGSSIFVTAVLSGDRVDSDNNGSLDTDSELGFSVQSGNGYIDVGNYVVNATITNNNYVLVGDISQAYTIQKADITGVIFNDISYNYDGIPHNVIATNYPAGSILSYSIGGITGNSAVDYKEGGYVVTLECNNSNYNTYTATAILTINKIDISGLELNNKTVTYDQRAHNLELLNVPNDVNVVWDSLSYTDVGTYYPIVTLSGNNYNTLVYNNDLSNRKSLTINPAELDDVDIQSVETKYNGKSHILPITTNGASVLYSIDGGSNYYESYTIIDANLNSYSIMAKFSKPNYNDKIITATLKIDKATSIIASNDSYVYKFIGTEIDLLSNDTISTNNTEANLTYTVLDNLQLKNAGVYLVILTIAETTNYLSEDKPIKVTIELNTRIVTAPSSQESVYDTNAVRYQERVGGNVEELTEGSYTYTFTKNGVDVTEILDAGEYTITITLAETLSYKTAVVYTTYLVKKATVTIVADDIQKKVYNKNTQSITVESVTNGIAYTCAPASATNAGSHNIRIIVEETNNYMSAEKSVTLVIEKASRANVLPESRDYIVEKNSITYDSIYHSYTFIDSIIDGVATDIYGNIIEEYKNGVVTYNTNNFRDSGEYVVHTYIAETENYKRTELTPNTATYRIEKADVNFVSKIGEGNNRIQSSQYTKSEQSVLFESNSDGRITYSSSLGDNLQSNPSFIDVGEYDVTINQAEGTNHKAGNTTFTLNITKKRINIIMATTSLDYRQTVETEVVFKWNIDSRTPLLSGDSLENSIQEGAKQLKYNDEVITVFDGLDAKTYTVTGVFSSINYELVIVEGQLIILPMILDTVTFSDIDSGDIYSGQVKSITAKASKTHTSAETDIEVKYNKSTVKNVGEYTAYVTQLTEGNYRLNEAALASTKNFVIKPSTLNLNSYDSNQTYLSTAAPTAIVRDGDILAGDEVIISLEPRATMNYNNLNVGQYYYDIKISNQNYVLANSVFELDVAPLDIKNHLSFEGITEEYSMTPKTISVKHDSQDNWLTKYGNQISITYINNNKTTAGEYVVTATLGVTANFVALAPMTANIKITPKELTSITLGEMIGGNTYTGLEKNINVSYTGMLGIDNPQVILAYAKNDVSSQFKTAGTYKVTVAGLNNVNYSLPATMPEAKEYTIAPKTLNLSVVRSRSLVFDGNLMGITGVEIVSGLVSGDSCEILLTNALNIDVGEYTAVVNLTNTDYMVSNAVNLNYSITQATFDSSGVIFNNLTVTYNGSKQRLSIASALPNGLNVAYTNNDNEDCGIYTVTASFIESAGLDNYKDIPDKTAVLTINRKNITVKSTNIQVEKGDTTTLTYAVEGAYVPLDFRLELYNGNTLVDVEIASLEVGSYTIKVIAEDYSNYNITYIDGTLEILVNVTI